MLELACLLIKMSSVEQRLCRDTATQSAGAAEPGVFFLFD